MSMDNRCGQARGQMLWIGSAAAILIVCAALEVSALRDITLDAVTMATVTNSPVGELAWLTDGRTPATDPQAPGVQWEWTGLVIVSWPDAVDLGSIQVYLGELRLCRISGYLGGGFTEEGQRLGEAEAAFDCEAVPPEGTTGWYEIPCASDEPIDNLSFQVVGGAVIYEMRFLTPGGTAVQPASLGQIKRDQSQASGRVLSAGQ